MDERPKIHIFLGAPPPASILASDAGTEEEERPPAGWRHLQLTWRGGRLKAAADVPGNEAEISRFYSGNEDPEASNQGLDKTEDPTEPESDGTTEWKEGRWNTDGGSACERGGLRSEVDPDGAEEDQCSASVQDYLDGCFPAAQPEPDSRPQPTPPPPSTRTQYLSTWTLSQALMLRGRHGVQSASSPEKTPPPVSSSTPELFSPTASSPGASMELFSPVCVSQRVEQGGVIMEATAEGVLCSQESRAPQDSPTRPPCSKKPKPSEDSKAAGGQSSSSTFAAPLQSLTTPLDRCLRLGLRFSVLVVVVHPCHLKEVQVKSGPSAGAFVPLASIVVTDQSGAEMKVVLWRRAAFWVLTVNPGDVLLITGLQVNEDKWRGETVLQSTFSSKLLNLGHASQPALTAANQRPPSLATQHVSARSLSSLCQFIRERRPLLVSLPSRAPQDLNRLPYVTLRTMRVNTLVHVLLRVKHSQLSPGWRNEAESRSRSAVQLKTVLTVEQPDGQQGVLLLWGAAMDWLPRLQRHREAVWDFRVLLVREGLTSDLLELHSTPWSLVRVLDPRDPRALDFDRAWRRQKGSSVPLELDLDTMLSQKYSGEVELRVQVLSFQFQEAPPSQNPPQPVLDSSTPLDAILTALGDDVTYTGCARCSTELDTDENGIYATCYPCLPHTAVRRFYRSAVVTVSRPGCALLGVRVPPVPLQKILQAPPDRLHRSSAPGSPVRNIQVAAEKIQTLLSLPKKTFIIIIRSHFLCDENSVPISQDFTLLDLRFPGP
ncbi:PREDICTED: protein FAM35A [Cyprinodon variegatus]|uniref:Shieldin complex subunit 2 n=1 Tax=Cyprinodon variegatus TaxID=28743 RepID=A0A3Q2CEC7_CYPVA|nr:PREDICTED: protein FAM35A [Cyprinodon variegatus]